jgi:hypothetical protein
LALVSLPNQDKGEEKEEVARSSAGVKRESPRDRRRGEVVTVEVAARELGGFDNLLLTPFDDASVALTVVTVEWVGREFIDCAEERLEG